MKIERMPGTGASTPALLLLTLATLTVVAATSMAATVTFRFRAPEGARTVTVAGTFNGWNSVAAPLGDADGDGLWEATLQVPEGTQQYKFVVNGTDWFTDEFATQFAPDGFGGRNSVMLVGTEPMTVGEPGGAALGESGTEVTFRFKPPLARVNSVSVAGSFNDWNAAAHPMALDTAGGVWSITLHLAPGEYAYQFVVDGDRWLTDEYADDHEDDGFGGHNALLRVGAAPIFVGVPQD